MPTSARQPPGPGQSAERTIPRPCRRGGLHIRPEPGTVSPGPRWLRGPGTDAPCAPLRRVRSAVVLLMSIPSGPMWASAPTGCGRRWCVRRGGAARAAMKAAPTPRFLFSRRGGLYGRPEAVALRQGSMVPPRRSRCPHRPASPRVRGSPPSAPFPVHVVGADFISARNQVRYAPSPGGCGSRVRTRHARPYGVRSAVVRPTQRCGTGGHEGRPYATLFVFP